MGVYRRHRHRIGAWPLRRAGGTAFLSPVRKMRRRLPGRMLEPDIRRRQAAGWETCLSALSQKKGELTGEEARLLREYGVAWGCDACQEACPLNRNVRIDPHSWLRRAV